MSMIQEERNFIHEINNKLAILEGKVAILIKKMDRKPEEFTIDTTKERLTSVLDVISDIAHLASVRRDLLIARMDEENQAG